MQLKVAVIAAVGDQNVVGSLVSCVCTQRFGAGIAGKDGWCCVEQSVTRICLL